MDEDTEVIPWKAQRHKLRLIQKPDGEWQIQHRYRQSNRLRWSEGTLATDFNYSLWMDLQEALEKIKANETKIKDALAIVWEEAGRLEDLAQTLANAGDERGALKAQAKVEGMVGAVAMTARELGVKIQTKRRKE